MKIIKNGDKKRLSKDKKFRCEKCGCIFVAGGGEYRVGSHYNELYYVAQCPCCGVYATVGEIKESD